MASFRTCVRCNKRQDEKKMQELFLSYEPATFGLFVKVASGKHESGWMFGNDCVKKVLKAGGKRDW